VQKAQGGGLREVATSAALAGAEYVMVYLSAHWCPPCKAFTPKLGAFVRTHAQRLGVKVVFASSDHTEAEFGSYFGEHPWDLAFPFGSVTISQLGEHFQVGGIPTLLVLDKSGQLITSDGREGVETHPDASGFPWRLPTLSEILASMDDGSLLVSRAGAPVPKGHLAKLDYCALYFSAKWCRKYAHRPTKSKIHPASNT
jgi:nucleoredoxin